MENRYNPYDWKAEIYKTPQEIYSALDSFGIYGKAIDSITVIGRQEQVLKIQYTRIC